MLSVENLISSKNKSWELVVYMQGLFFVGVERVGRYGRKQKPWCRLDRIELTLCSNSRGVKSSFADLHSQPSDSSPLQDSESFCAEQLRGFAVPSSHAANLHSFPFTNESFLITSYSRVWLLSWSSYVHFKRQRRFWTWEAFYTNDEELVGFIFKKVKVFGT